MQSSTALSSPSFPSTPNSRPQRPNHNHNRKSGLSSDQNQTQIQNQYHTQSRQNTYNGSNPRHTQKASGLQANSRRQSLPPQQRGYGSISKVDAAAVSPVVDTADHGRLIQHVPQQQQQQQEQRQQRNRYPQLNSKPRPQSQPQPSKARRVQRRREIDAVAESLACVDLDLDFSQSPPLNPSSPPSSSDSDDSESTLSRSSNFLGSKVYRHVINSPPQRPFSAPVPHTQSVQRTSYVSRASAFQAHSSMDMMQRPGSADSVMLAGRVPVEKKNGLYAGPTFHNSPAPTSLPIPSFGRSLGSSPVEPSAEKLPSGPFFGEAASPQLNSLRLQYPQQPSPNWTGRHSTPLGVGYNVPDRMATSSFVPHGSASHGSDQLMEISQNLRILLKIQSQ
ncbi:hypothetical protein BGZ95_002811 [Linnemannia exigua]|uniref:Uncharacterized protein n=1 Tax=Linnemannia exigua TaxID=604196 RepID=A0AAD4H1T1_9FUNG|nr:hypothetical protein BGZ95_002811 [Linnemannia exigua]